MTTRGRPLKASWADLICHTHQYYHQPPPVTAKQRVVIIPRDECPFLDHTDWTGQCILAWDMAGDRRGWTAL